jgi:hypothetical protein
VDFGVAAVCGIVNNIEAPCSEIISSVPLSCHFLYPESPKIIVENPV